jgi:hypothetical protein
MVFVVVCLEIHCSYIPIYLEGVMFVLYLVYSQELATACDA